MIEQFLPQKKDSYVPNRFSAMSQILMETCWMPRFLAGKVQLEFSPSVLDLVSMAAWTLQLLCRLLQNMVGVNEHHLFTACSTFMFLLKFAKVTGGSEVIFPHMFEMPIFPS